jgi:hypothetical protein
VTTRNAVLAEWFIAVPVSIVQPATGYLLMARWQRLALGAFAGVLLLFWLRDPEDMPFPACLPSKVNT